MLPMDGHEKRKLLNLKPEKEWAKYIDEMNPIETKLKG